MGGTKEGGQAAAETNLKRYGADFYSKIGTKGGKTGSRGKGFAGMSREQRQAAGRKGGALGSRAEWSKQEYLARVKAYAEKHGGTHELGTN